MVGKRKRVHAQSGKGIKADVNPSRIQEYDFFVAQDGGEESEKPEADRSVREKKNFDRGKGTKSFFRD